MLHPLEVPVAEPEKLPHYRVRLFTSLVVISKKIEISLGSTRLVIEVNVHPEAFPL